MDTMIRLAALSLLGASAWAAQFQSGQAARAVIGQPSFSAREPGITISRMGVSNGFLYLADTARGLWSLDLTKIPAPDDDFARRQGAGCVLCGFTPVPASGRPPGLGLAAASSHGNTVVAADAANHRVLIWNNVALLRGTQDPDVVLGRLPDAGSSPSKKISATSFIEPISVAFDGKRLFVGDAALHRVLVWNSLPAHNNQPADAVLGQPDFTTVLTPEAPGAGTIGRPAALASDGTNLFVADSENHRVLVFTPADTPLASSGVVNSASLSGRPVAPGTLVTITGAGLSDASESASDDGSQPLPEQLAGAQVIFDGVALPLLSVSPGQVRAQIPYDLGNASSGSLYVRTEHENGRVTVTNAAAVNIAPESPGLFAFAGTEPRNGLILHVKANSPAQAGEPVTDENPARPGEILIAWATGLGRVTNDNAEAEPLVGRPYSGPDAETEDPVGALVSGHSAQVLSARLPQGSIGVYEIRVLLPRDLPTDSKTQLLIMQNGYVSNTVTFPVVH